jgi:histidinol-phosphatase
VTTPGAPPIEPELLALAVDIAREAGELTLGWFRARDLTVDTKVDGTPVTVADRAAERLVRERLAEVAPGDGVLGEEEPEAESRTGRRWIVDPIDGTKAFVRGVPLYTTLLALDDEHGPAIGVIVVPALGEVVAAGRGLGCWHDGEPAHVSATATLADAWLTTTAYSHWPDAALLGVKAAGCRLRAWGDGYGYALVATGRADVMVDPEANRWDLAPMLVLVTEAGGRFTDLSGTARFDGGNGVASNGHLHDAALAVLAG